MDVGLPGGSEVKNPLASAGDTDSILGQEDPLEKGMAFLLGKCQWTGDLGGLQSMGSLPEKVFFFAWEVLWAEEFGGLQSMGLKKVTTT